MRDPGPMQTATYLRLRRDHRKEKMMEMYDNPLVGRLVAGALVFLGLGAVLGAVGSLTEQARRPDAQARSSESADQITPRPR